LWSTFTPTSRDRSTIVRKPSSTAIGSALVKSGTYTTETTNTLTVSAATLAAFGVDDFDNANLKVRLRFQRSNGSVGHLDGVRGQRTAHARLPRAERGGVGRIP
jgi:hypothetical protein